MLHSDIGNSPLLAVHSINELVDFRLKGSVKGRCNFNIVQLWNTHTHTPLTGLFMANVKLKVGFPLVLIVLRTLHFYSIFWFLVCAQIKNPQRNFKKYILFSKQSKYYVFWGERVCRNLWF